VAVAQAPARPRGGGGRLFIIVGVVLALLGFGLAVILPTLTGNGGGGTTAGGPTDLVVYAAKDISLRTQITNADQVKVVKIPDTYKPAGAITIDAGAKAADQPALALKAVKNFIAEIDIAKDQPLLTSMLAKPGENNISGAQAAFLPIPTGYVALTLPTSELNGVANYIQPGDYISVLAAAGSGKTGATATVFTQLHVIRVGAANLSVTSASSNSSSSATTTPVAPTSITVVVTPCQSELIKWLQQSLQVSYELESFQDYAKAVTGPDNTCPDLNSAKGVQVTDIIAKFPVFKQALGGP
jgi:Flp pilus assembly protein CpaB